MANNIIKEGNLVQYVGRVQGYYNKVGQVKSIDKTHDDTDSFLLKIVDYKKQEHEIRAYQNEVWPVTLNVGHLDKLGFIKENETNVFTLETLVLIRPFFIYHTENGSSYIDKGFVVVEKNLKLPLKEDEVDANTTPVTSLHALQNYIEGKIVKAIDWTIFLSDKTI
jgi:hypothetical protein